MKLIEKYPTYAQIQLETREIQLLVNAIEVTKFHKREFVDNAIGGTKFVDTATGQLQDSLLKGLKEVLKQK